MNQITLHKIVSQIEIPNIKICLGTMGDGFFVQLKQKTTCNRDGTEYISSGRKWYISSHTVENEVVFTVFKAWLTWLEHEAHEQFQYMGHKIFDPHTSIDGLIEASKRLQIRC